MKTFGKLPSGLRLKKILQSPNYKNGQFQNIETTAVNPDNVSIFKMTREFFSRPANVYPEKPLPFIKTVLCAINADKPVVTWFGHSSYLISSKKTNILVDPVFSGHASPLKQFAKSFPGTDQYSTEDIPAINVLIITHDHYDHLDFETVSKLKDRVSKVITPLGVGSHLQLWGYKEEQITELDWQDSYPIADGITITATPARHFSGRGIKRFKTLWASFMLQLHGYKIFIGGDSGYDSQFKINGERFGGCDLALLECGQYGKDWPQIHMFPEQTVKAARDLNATILFPVHWGKFSLALHPWNEPIKKLIAEAHKSQQPLVSPMIGQPYVIGSLPEQKAWWDF